MLDFAGTSVGIEILGRRSLPRKWDREAGTRSACTQGEWDRG